MFKKLLNKFTILFKHNIVINSRWGKRLLFMMLLCAFAGITVLTISNYNLRNEMNTGNQAFVNTFANNIDSILVSNNQTLYQITADSKINAFASGGFSDSKNLIFNSVEVSEILKNAAIGNYCIDNILIYSAKTGRIADIHGSSTIDEYYNVHIGNASDNALTYADFMALLNESKAYTLLRLDSSEYIANIQRKQDHTNDYTIVLLMNPAKVFETFSKTDFSPYGILAMRYKDGNIFIYDKNHLSYQNTDADYPLSYTDRRSKTTTITLDGNKYLATGAPSSIDDFVYLFLDDYSRTDSIIKFQILLIFLLSALSTLISGTYIYRYISANFRQIHKILYTIQPEVSVNSDLMNTLEQQIADLLMNKNIAEEKLLSQSSAIISNKMEILLHFPAEDPTSLIEEFQSLGIDWKYDYFAVLGFYISNYGEFAETGDDSLFGNAYNTCQFVLQNIFEELISKKYTVTFTHADNMLVAVVNLPKKSDSEINSLISVMNEGVCVISEFFKFKYVISLSEPGEGVESLPSLYAHMLTNLESITSEDESGTIYKYSLETSKDSNILPLKKFDLIETQLYNSIKAKDFDTALNLLEQCNEVFPILTKSNDARLCVFKLSSTIASALHTIIDDETFEEILNIVVITETVVIPYQYLEKIKNLFLDIKENYLADDTKSDQSDSNLSDKINDYILANLSCKDLNIPMICDYMDMPSRILSQEYKKQTGNTVNKYIQTSRVELAKRLLVETDLSINEIADRTGYDYTISFARLFKKYENISPSEYRQFNKRS